jgi:hypothetical protein
VNAQLLLNELYVNSPGADEPFEFIELKGTPGSTLNNIYVVVFESDSGSAGNADVVIPLNGVTLGSNGLLFIGTSLGYPDIPSETVFKDTLLFGLPLLENGSISFTVMFSPIPMLKDVDYDTNNDGVLSDEEKVLMLGDYGPEKRKTLNLTPAQWLEIDSKSKEIKKLAAVKAKLALGGNA